MQSDFSPDSFFSGESKLPESQALCRHPAFREERWAISIRERLRENSGRRAIQRRVKCTRAWSAARRAPRYQSRPLHAERILETQAVISSTTKRLTESERLLTALRLRGSFAPFLFLPLSLRRCSFLFAPLRDVRFSLRHAALPSLSPHYGQDRRFPANCEQLSEAKSRNIMKLITLRD